LGNSHAPKGSEGKKQNEARAKEYMIVEDYASGVEE
jgi:hypothetical protein